MNWLHPEAPIELAVEYGERRALREAEERDHPERRCERIGHIMVMDEERCTHCGEVIS